MATISLPSSAIFLLNPSTIQSDQPPLLQTINSSEKDVFETETKVKVIKKNLISNFIFPPYILN